MAQKYVLNVWCTRNAEAAAQFYADAFPEASWRVTSRYPTEESELLDFQRPFAGEVLTADVDLGGWRMSLINAGDEFRPGPALSVMANVDPLDFDGDEAAARTWFDGVWARLADGGEVRMPVGEYPFSRRYGWVQDRFGVNWQLILTDPAGDTRPRYMPALMFSGAAQGRAREAVEAYTGLFPHSQTGTLFPYPEPTGPAAAGELAFADFRLGDQWFVAMDSGSPDPWAFSPGMSIEVQCDDQAEIDRYWDALSAVPEAEACGWLADRFGVSWQIVPADMGELMQHPGAYGRMLGMKKLVIADL